MKVKDNEEGPEICVECQGEYEESERVGILRCGHEYNVDCMRSGYYKKMFAPTAKSTHCKQSARIIEAGAGYNLLCSISFVICISNCVSTYIFGVL